MSTQPARPDDARTIRSYIRRGGRLNARQQQAWDTYADRWVVPHAVQTNDGYRLTDAFHRSAPLVIEIGLGVGEALAAGAVATPERNFVGFEVWQPGVADCLAALGAAGATNVRLSTLDAAWCLEQTAEAASISELWTYFPDPWQKARHHKRRLVSPEFARLVASRLAPGGIWRLATDWSNYAEHMRAVLDAEPAFAGGVTERYAGRPLTRFERRGLAAGRVITDLTYTRT